jgi:electron transport complex protein RnfG
MGSFIKESWLMVFISVLSGLTVAAVYNVEKPRIDQNASDYLNRSVLAVVPGGARVESAKIDGLTGVHKVMDVGGSFVGWGVEAQGPGFQGIIKVVVGLDRKAQTITGMTVVDQSETPGLGDNIKQDQWRTQFAGKAASGEPLEVVKATPSKPHHIHAISAATISSKAVATIVNDRLAKVKDQLAREAGL